MAVLSDQDRFDCWAEYMRDARVGAMAALTKNELRTALNDIDAFLNTNASAINTAISQPARGALTTAQKALLLMFVVAKRYVTGA